MNKHRSVETYQYDRLTSQIYNRILSIVHHQGIARNEKLSSISLSQALGVSRTPVSFVLYQMEKEGLIKNEGKSGWSVITLTVEDLLDIFSIQELLFPNIIKLANLKITSDNAAKLIIFAEEMERCLKQNDFVSWRLAERGYKHLISLSAGNTYLYNILNNLDNRISRLVLTLISLKNTNHDVFRFYRDIAQAINSENEEVLLSLANNFIKELEMELIKLIQEVVNPLLGTKRQQP